MTVDPAATATSAPVEVPASAWRSAFPSARTTGIVLTLTRLAAGVAMLGRPEAAARALGQDAGTAARAQWLMRLVAARDLALGAGALAGAATGQAPRSWIAAGAASDAVDAVVIASAVRTGRLAGPRAWLTAGVAAVSALLGVAVVIDSLRRR